MPPNWGVTEATSKTISLDEPKGLTFSRLARIPKHAGLGCCTGLGPTGEREREEEGELDRVGDRSSGAPGAETIRPSGSYEGSGAPVPSAAS